MSMLEHVYTISGGGGQVIPSVIAASGHETADNSQAVQWWTSV